ncbi:MAG: redoxin domain-containing protein [Thermoanaerobaculia bacterium]
MKTRNAVARHLALCTALLAGGLVSTSAQAAVAVGDSAPAFELLDLNGKKVALSDFAGKTVVLEWINPECPVSRGYAEKKIMIATAAAHPEAVWLGINSTHAKHADFVAPAEHLAYDSKQGIAYPVLYDSSGEVGRAYGAKTTPHMFIIDGAGKVAYNGAIDSGPGAASTNYVGAALTALAAGKRPDPATTKPMGCSVKYAD